MNKKHVIRIAAAVLGIAVLATAGGFAGAYIYGGSNFGAAAAAPATEARAYHAGEVTQADFAIPDGDSILVARAFQERTRTLAREILPVVVEVNVVNVVTQRLPGGSPFDFFFGNL